MEWTNKQIIQQMLSCHKKKDRERDRIRDIIKKFVQLFMNF